MKKVFFFFIFLCLACNNSEKCFVGSSDNLIQEYQTQEEIFVLYQMNHGAWGGTITLRVCSFSENKLIEEISLRGEDHLPQIDSVIANNVYIHYEFPRDTPSNGIEMLDFSSVALGKALLNPEELKYNYIISNKNNDVMN